MPVIRQIESSVGLGGAPSPSIQVDDSIGQGLRSVGSSLSSAVQAEQQMQLRREQMDMQVSEFRADQSFRRFQDSLGVDLADAQQKMDPSGAGLTEGFVQRFDEQSSKFLEQVPAALRPKFDELVQTSRAGWVDRVAVQERDQRYNWFRTGITESQEKLQGQVFNDPALYDAARADGLRAIEASGLPEVEKEELRQEWDEVLAATIGEREVRDIGQDPTRAIGAGARLGVPSEDASIAAVVDQIIGVESSGNANARNPRSSASGLGQFTDGTWLATIKRHRPDIASGQSDAALLRLKTDPRLGREMTVRHTEDNATALRSVGMEVTPGNLYLAHFAGIGGAQRVLRAPDSQALDNALGADAVRANPFLAGKNVAWLKAWADDKMGDAAIEPDPRYAALSLSQRLEIYDRTQAAADRGAAAIEAQKKAANASAYDSLTLGVETGEVVSEQTILNSAAIDDGQKATLLKAFRAKREESAGVGELISAITSGDGVSINSFDSEQTKVGDKAYQRMIEAVPQENRQAVTRAFVQETGYIPKPEIAVIRQAVEQGNPAGYASVLTMARNYQIAAPEHFENADGLSAARRDLELFTAYTDNMGYSAEEAALKVLARRNPEREMNEEVLGAKADKILKDVTADEVARYFSGGLRIFGGTGTPSAGADTFTQSALMSDFNVAFRERFLETGDEDEAKALAANDLQKTWGVSEISGDRHLMKYPPEKFYPPVDGGFDYLRADAVQTATEFAGSEPTRTYLRPWIDPVSGRNLTAEDIRAGRSPRYRLIYQREENGQRVIDMAPGTWAMPADEISRLTAEAQERQMQAAQEEREFQRRVVAPVAGEGISAVQNALRGQRAPSVQRTQRAEQAGTAIGAMAAPVEPVEVRDLAEPQGVEGVRSSVQQQGRELRNGGGGW